MPPVEFEAHYYALERVRKSGRNGNDLVSGFLGTIHLEAISGVSTGSEKIWMGESHIGPATRSDNHHHGESETGIYVLSGNPVFVFLQDNEESRIKAQPGDYIYVPPYVAHREENPSEEEDAVVILARTTQEAIVVNLPSLE